MRTSRACKAAKVYILDNVLPADVEERLQAGVMIAAGGIKEAAEIGRR